MGGPLDIESADRRQAQLFRWMTLLSVFVHTGTLLLCSSMASLFPDSRPSPVVIVEIADPPMSTLPEEKPASAGPAGAKPGAGNVKAPRESMARTWLRRMDAGLAGLSEAPARHRAALPGLPVRRWESGRPPGSADFAPAAAPESGALSGHVSGLENRIRRSGVPGVPAAGKTDFVAMFGGSGAAAEAVPSWLRAMIRKKVLEYLPELEAAYTIARLRHPGLAGTLTLRFRIGPAGAVQHAEPGDTSLPDAEFVATVLQTVRRWTFESVDGRTVEVTYPFVFLEPSS